MSNESGMFQEITDKANGIQRLKDLPEAKSYWVEIEKSRGYTIEITKKVAENLYNHAQIMGNDLFFKITSSDSCFIQFEDRSTVGKSFSAIKNEILRDGDMEELC